MEGVPAPPSATTPGPLTPDGDAFRPTQAASAYPFFSWGRAEYLLWVIKAGRQPPPLVTTGPATADNPAALTDPMTTVLYPRDNVEYGGFSGGRLTVGFWCNSCETCGFEMSGFLFEKRFNTFQATSDAGGNPILGVPFVDAATGTELVNFASSPGLFSGGVQVTSAARLWGMEGDFYSNLYRGTFQSDSRPVAFGDWRVDLLAGFRYVSLIESLDITQPSVELAGGFTDFNGAAVQTGDAEIIHDSFGVRSQFFGGQVGARSEFDHGPFYAELLGKVALGDSHETVRVDGNTTLIPAATGVPVVAPGGFLATATNIGRKSRDEFAVVPELGVNVGYQPVPLLRFFVGYTFLYWSDVVRAGDQIDRTVNLTAVPSSATFGTLTGPPRPVVPFRTTDLWVQGVNFGFEVRY